LGVPTSEEGYISATTGRGDHEVHKGHLVALKKNISEAVTATNDVVKNLSYIEN
jgi:hypothetical protein